MAGVLANLSSCIVSSSEGSSSSNEWKKEMTDFTIFDALKRLAYVDDQVRRKRLDVFITWLDRTNKCLKQIYNSKVVPNTSPQT